MIKTRSIILGIAALLAITCSCSRERCAGGRITDKAVLSVRAEAPVSVKSVNTWSGVIYILDQWGHVVLGPMDFSGEDGMDIRLDPGTYRAWAFFNGSYELLSRIQEEIAYTNPQDIWIYLEDLYYDGNFSEEYQFAMASIDGSDGAVTLSAGDSETVTLSGRPLTAKINVNNITNSLDEENAGRMDDYEIMLTEMNLLNVPVYQTGKVTTMNEYTLYNVGGVSDYNPMFNWLDGPVWIPQGETFSDGILLYTMANPNTSYPVKLRISMQVNNESYTYDIPFTNIQAGLEYSVNINFDNSTGTIIVDVDWGAGSGDGWGSGDDSGTEF